MATSAEDSLIDDGINPDRFSGMLSFVAESTSSQSLSQETSHCVVVDELPESRTSRPGPVSIRFEVIDARIDDDEHGKFVVYTILVTRSDGMDSSPAKVDRRYSDFERLNKLLHKKFPAHMHDVSFPGKRLSGNYKAETIARRSRAFEQYLSHIFSINALRTCADLAEFFYGQSIRDGYRYVSVADYSKALAPLRSAWRLQAKLLGDSDPEAIATLCAIIAVHVALDDDLAACTHAERALECFGDTDKPLGVDRHLVPVMKIAIRLSWKLGRDKRRLEARFEELRQRGVDVVSPPPLLELVLNRFEGHQVT